MAFINIQGAVSIITLIFLIAPAFILVYVFVQNQRKKIYNEEKIMMRLSFESEIAKTQYEVQEQTMQTIGADLHDNIGQLLSLTSLTLNSIELDNTVNAKQKIDTAVDLTVRSIKEMRLLGKLLQGDQLMVSGLPEAIRHEVNWIERSGKYTIVYNKAGEFSEAGNPDKDLIVFRVLQEILNNIIKHASATLIWIDLDYVDSLLKLQVRDNGIGFNTQLLPEQSMGMGLRNIQKRSQIVNGKVNIASTTGGGTTITILIPYP